MKRPLTRGEKLLFASPILFVLAALGVQQWQKAQKPPKTSVIIELTDSDAVTTLSFSPNGKQFLVTGGFKFTTGQVYDIDSRSKLYDLQAPPHTNGYLYYSWPAWSPDGNRIVAVYSDGTRGTQKIYDTQPTAKGGYRFYYNFVTKIALWDATNGNLTAKYLFAPLNENANSYYMSFLPDGKKLFSYESPSLFDAATGRRLQVLKGTFSQASKGYIRQKLGLLAVINKEGTRFQVYDTKAKRVVYQAASKYFYEFSWPGTVLGVTSSEGILLWDANTRTALRPPQLRHHGLLESLALNPKQSTVAYFDADRHYKSDQPSKVNGELVVWDYRQNRALRRYPATTEIRNIRWSPNGKRLSAMVGSSITSPSRVVVFDSAGHVQSEHPDYGLLAAWSPDSRHLALSRRSNTGTREIEILDIGE